MKIISIILVLVSVFLGLKHGWDTFQPGNGEQTKMMATLGISKAVMPYIGVVSILAALMLLFPQTFFYGNLLSALSIVSIMALALRAGDVKMALIEIPFLFIPLILIWLKYPFKF
ncbi:MAG: DoxX family protein [Dysgonomonas sp.]